MRDPVDSLTEPFSEASLGLQTARLTRWAQRHFKFLAGPGSSQDYHCSVPRVPVHAFDYLDGRDSSLMLGLCLGLPDLTTHPPVTLLKSPS